MDDLDLLTTIARAPMRTMRFRALRDLGSNTWRQLDELVSRGALLRLAHGVYTAPPDGRDSAVWTPGLETAALALGTARHGERAAVLMGIGAARHWGALPRAVGTTVIAVPTAGHGPVELPTGTVHFVRRDLARLDVVLERTELGQALVTTPEQTLFDLLMKPHQGGDPDSARTAAQQILPEVDLEEFSTVAAAYGRLNDDVRAVLASNGSR